MRIGGMAAILLLSLGAIGCQSAPARAYSSSAPPLALETFDEVWRIIHEHHFDTNFNGHDWLKVRAQFRPRVQHAVSHRQAREVIEEMLDLLNVSHLELAPGDLVDLETDAAGAALEEAEEEDSGTLGMEVRYAGKDLLVTSVEPGLPAGRAGIRPGWTLRRIAGHDTAAIYKKLAGEFSGRDHEFMAWRSASKWLSGLPESRVELRLTNGRGQPRTVELTRADAPGEAIQFGNLPVMYAHLSSRAVPAGPRSIGVIKFNIWMLPTALAFHRAIDEHRGRDGIIIDLRGNVGGVVGMIIGVAGHFVTRPVTLGTMQTRDNTLKLPANPRFTDAGGKPVQPYTRPVAILVDEITASASEVFTGGLQEHGRVRVFGRTTAGKALPATAHTLPNGDVLYRPVADFVTPGGTRFEGRGVIPDVPVPLDRRALLRGSDEVTDAAIRWIATQAN